MQVIILAPDKDSNDSAVNCMSKISGTPMIERTLLPLDYLFIDRIIIIAERKSDELSI